MANKRRILTVTLLIAILGVASWLIPSQPGEPVYQGKRLSFWCEQYAKNHYMRDANIELEKQAETAIRTIGTNAIPTLLGWLNARDSKLKLKLIQLTQKQHLINIKWRMAETQHLEASSGLACLGPQAKSALPALIEIYNEDLSGPYHSPMAICAIFASMGPEAADAVPRLVQSTTDTGIPIRWYAVRTLGFIHSKPELVVPALTRSLRDPVIGVRANAAIGLGNFGSDAQSAVPELINLLGDPSVDIKNDAATALKKIDPEAAAKAGVK